MTNEKQKRNEEKTPPAIDENKPSGNTTESATLNQPDELAKLRQYLKVKEEEAKENYERYLRQVAELENFKKRTNREREEAIRFANETLVKDLLPIVDNLERAVVHSKDGANGKTLVEGIEMVLRGLFDVLAKHGVVQVSAVGQPFDPEKHEAMAQVEVETHKPNTIVDEYHKGYMFRDRLLRPALVSVAKPLESQEKKNDGHKVENGSSDD
jgi:molecular chaperone GrpE